MIRLVLYLDSAQMAALRARARPLGISPLDYAQGVLERELTGASSEETSTPPDRERGALVRCLCPVCDVFAMSRGLCSRHYQMARNYVRNGVLSAAWLAANNRWFGRPDDADDFFMPRTKGLLLRTQDKRWLFGADVKAASFLFNVAQAAPTEPVARMEFDA